MADNLFTFLGIFCTFMALFFGAYNFFRFENFDQVRVDNFLQKNGANNKAFVIGHRGSMLEAPENTLAAFRHAAESGADAVEFDVDFSKDGHAIVIHDATVDRTTDSSGRVCDYTLEEIRKLNALGDVFKNRYCEVQLFNIKKQQKFYSLPKRYNKIRCFEQRPFIHQELVGEGGEGTH